MSAIQPTIQPTCGTIARCSVRCSVRPAGSCALSRGITLIEVMVTVAVFGILSAIAVPSFSGLMASSRANAGASSLWSGIQLARSEAIRHNRSAHICPSTDGATCASPAPPATFATGWIVWVDRNGNGALDNVGEIVRVEGTMHRSVSVVGSQAIRYNAMGRPMVGAGAGTALASVSIEVRTSTPVVRSRFVCVNRNGLPMVQNGVCS